MMAVGRIFHLSVILLSISLLPRLSFEPSIFKLQDNTHESFGYELLHSSTSRLADFKSFLSIFTLLNLSDKHRVIWFKRKFFKCRILYSANCTASFNPSELVLIRSGDIHPLPGPETLENSAN